MKEYHKIETLFERDITGSKKLIPWKWRNDTVAYLADFNWMWTEKVDGTNIRIHWDGHQITFGGRTERANIPADLMNYLNRTFLNEETEQLFEQKFGEKEVTLYGEGYGPKIQKGGGLYRDDVSFILFDVLCSGWWLRRDDVEDIAEAFGIDVVPVVEIGPLGAAIDYIRTNPASMLSDKAKMEGLVCRPVVELHDRSGKRLIVKIKYNDFKDE
jgi:hypothetical protein